MDDFVGEADVIGVYTREDAIRNRVLVRLDVRESGKLLDVCFTANLWHDSTADELHRLPLVTCLAYCIDKELCNAIDYLREQVRVLVEHQENQDKRIRLNNGPSLAWFNSGLHEST